MPLVSCLNKTLLDASVELPMKILRPLVVKYAGAVMSVQDGSHVTHLLQACTDSMLGTLTIHGRRLIQVANTLYRLVSPPSTAHWESLLQLQARHDVVLTSFSSSRDDWETYGQLARSANHLLGF